MLDFTTDATSAAAAAEPAPVNDQPLLDAYSNAVIDVTDRVGPAVVRVETGPKVRNARERGGLGSGIVISPDGLVLTNSHVVGASKEIRLRDSEGFVTDAHVLGVDPDTDLALLRADGARELRYAALGNSKHLAAASSWSRSAIRSASNRRSPPAWCRARPLDPLGLGPHHRGCDPDRCRAQPRQFRRRAGVVECRGDRRQHRDHPARAGHLLCGRQQHRAVRAVGDHPSRLCPPRLYRRRPARPRLCRGGMR